jgi:hypothetical protein
MHELDGASDLDSGEGGKTGGSQGSGGIEGGSRGGQGSGGGEGLCGRRVGRALAG